MPVYDYQCESCGPFTTMRPMAACDEPHPCPECGKEAARAWLTAPRLGIMASRRAAFAASEVSTASSHGGGCACCAGSSARFGNAGRKAGSAS